MIGGFMVVKTFFACARCRTTGVNERAIDVPLLLIELTIGIQCHVQCGEDAFPHAIASPQDKPIREVFHDP